MTNVVQLHSLQVIGKIAAGILANPEEEREAAIAKACAGQPSAFEAELRAALDRTAGRMRRALPAKDGELTPVMELLDDALSTNEPEPPMRDPLGRPIRIVSREPDGLHALTAKSANGESDDEKEPPPPPATHMFVPHTLNSMARQIEKYIEFYVSKEKRKRGAPKDAEPEVIEEGGKRLQEVFVKSYLDYDLSTLPKADKLLTLPIVLADGTLMAKNGLDRQHRIVFRIDPEIIKLLPKPEEITNEEIGKAMQFLVNEWLVDVKTDDVGKCILVALMLTVLERALIGDRPTFWVTAGKRGGGKTTALKMVSAALSGIGAAAASAWSPNEEERRKALFAMLRQSLPMIVFDNIKKGTMISCPHINTICTSDTWEDRVLSQSIRESVSCATILCFTGNNIGPKGDQASRSLVTRINVDRPDPENRKFKHSQPVRWTLVNRPKILAALYTILLGNPRFRPGAPQEEEKTRFKVWWHLVGASIEHAAACAGLAPIDFTSVFLQVEDNDEETDEIADVLIALERIFGTEKFNSNGVSQKLKGDSNGDSDKSTLKHFFASGQENAPHPKTISKMLKEMLDGPVFVEDGIITLKGVLDSSGRWSFEVKREEKPM